MLSRYEVARVVGLRALHLSEGSPPHVQVESDQLKRDMIYIAALELRMGKLDAVVRREDGTCLHVKDARLPPNLDIFLDSNC